MHQSLLRPLGGGIAVLAISFAGVSVPSFAFAAPGGEGAPEAVTVADLADDSALQQHWLSIPGSRLTVNPESTSPSLADARLDTSYYSDQKYPPERGVVRNALTDSGVPEGGSVSVDEGDSSPAFHDDFAEVDGWSTSVSNGNGAVITATAEGGRVAVAATGHGSVEHVVTVDAAVDPVLTVTVASTTGKWALKLADQDGTTEWDALQGDTSKTGTFAYDLSGVIPAGERTLRLRFYQIGENTSTTFESVSIHFRPAVSDDFGAPEIPAWTQPARQWGQGASLASTDAGGVLTSPASFGAVERPVTIDLDSDPILTVSVASATGKWALRLTNDTDGADIALVQPDTSATGTFSYNLADVTGLTGQQTFWVKLFSIGDAPSQVRFTRLSLHGFDAWTKTPSAYQHTWNPQALQYSGTFGDAGSYSTTDVFVDEDTVARIVDPASLTHGAPTLTGDFHGTPGWDPADQVLTTDSAALTGADYGTYTRSVAFPDGAQVLFFDSAFDASVGEDPATAPTPTSTTWLAILPDDRPTSLGIGFAYGNDGSARATADSRAHNGADLTTAVSAIDARTEQWNTYLAKVPAAADFSLGAVDPGAVTTTDIRRMYYRAWVDLGQQVLPPSPESPIQHHQIATGKASDYTWGPPNNKASAAWDSILSMQYYAYIDPDVAWDAFIGMMADVDDEGSLNGEALPSRKAQTAWTLYTVTGDTDKLASLYSTLKKHMNWAGQHPAWNAGSHYDSTVPPEAERDAEFVVSLAIDYGYAIDIARVLGHDDDVAAFESARATLLQQYKEWFFPNGLAVQYKWTTFADRPDGRPGDDKDLGTAQYVATGLHLPGLDEDQVSSLMARFDGEYDPDAQFAGLASDAVKAPDAQFVAYGLLEHGRTSEAQVFLEAMLRDIARTNTFAEVYQAGDPPIARGVYPSTFGDVQVIDNVWILNGYRSDEGTPTFVRLPGKTGGITGLTYLGNRFDTDIDGTAITLSGPASKQPGVCTTIESEIGVSTELSTTCAQLDSSAATIVQGQQLTVHGSKFPASGDVTITLRSDPVTVGTARTATDGTFTTTITIPSGTDPGDHTLTAAAGTVTGSTPLTITAADPGNGSGGGGGGVGDGGTGDGGTGGGGTGDGGGTGNPIGQPAATGNLAATGTELGWSIAAVLALLTTGTALLLHRRRRTAAHPHTAD